MIQGSFLGRRPYVPLQPPQVAQASPYATELPDGFLTWSRRGRGQALPEPVQRKMEAAFGADFGDVRIHVGSEASSIGALAFAHGSDVFFAPGLYDPHTAHGQRLLGHELAHVVQQRQGRVRNPFGAGVAVVQDPGLEAEAERLGMAAASLPLAVVDRYHGAEGGAAAASTGSQGGATQARMGGSPPGAALAPHVAMAVGARQGGEAPAAGASSAGISQPKAAAQLAGRAMAPHVQAAVTAAFQPNLAPQPKLAPPGAGREAAGPAGSPKGPGYRLILGSYMHRSQGADRLPEDLAGHTFVAIEDPQGRRQAWGFSPAQYNRMSPQRDLGRLTSGVQGKIHGDESAFSKPGVRTRSFAISEDQARAAMAKVAEFRSHDPEFSLQRRACSSFAMDVARAAAVDPFPGARIKKPREIYHQL